MNSVSDLKPPRQISRQIMSFRCVSSANRLKLESLLLKAAQKEEYSEELQSVLKHYHNDFDASRDLKPS